MIFSGEKQTANLLPGVAERANAIYLELYGTLVRRTDRFFAFLMICQWPAAIACALFISPRAWAGAESSIHVHVWAAVLLGGLISLVPAALAMLYPGRVATRHVIAVSQMLMSALLIHLSGGRIETHFHIFGSLAFLAFYRDWRVLMTASVVVALDHFLRGVYWPESVYAILMPERWRWLEHTAWVIFEDVFLIYACVVGLRELRALSVRSASLEESTSRSDKLRQMAENANDAKSAFLANMSHEIRTPLGAILGFSQLLDDATLDKTTRAKYVDVINRNGQVLTRIIDDILDLSKVEAGKMEIEKVSFSLSRLIADVSHSLSVRSQDKGLKFDVEHTGAMHDTIESDPTRIRQILFNVVGNAIKFTTQGSVKVTVDTRDHAADVAVSISITDTGCGLSADEQLRIFQPFSQADVSTTRKFGGTGLGLILSRKLAESMGGTLALIDSERHRGSTFRLAFVASRGTKTSRTEAPAAIRSGANRTQKALDGIRILVADDSPDNQLLIKHMLVLDGAKVDVVGNGVEAVSSALADSYDLVLMDVQMPEMDGLTATRHLREQGFSRPIVALTAHAMREDRDKCLHAGCTDHLTKPIGRDRLIATIAEYASPTS